MKSLVTIDVEGTLTGGHAPDEDPFASVDRVDAMLADTDLTASLFVTPAVVRNRPAVVERWLDGDSAVGLHVHPAQLSVGESDWLTDYDRDAIARLLATGCETFEDVLDVTPSTFRAGRWEYSERLLSALDAQGITRDFSLKPARGTDPYTSAGVREFPLTVYGGRAVRLLTAPWEFNAVPLTADAFLTNPALAAGFHAVTWRLLNSDAPYVMASYHDYDLLDPAVAKRVERYQSFLVDRSTPVTVADL